MSSSSSNAAPMTARDFIAKWGHAAELGTRTLTNLYDARLTWLAGAHAALDAAVAAPVAAAYGWTDNTATMSDDEIRRRLLALNFERSCGH